MKTICLIVLIGITTLATGCRDTGPDNGAAVKKHIREPAKTIDIPGKSEKSRPVTTVKPAWHSEKPPRDTRAFRFENTGTTALLWTEYEEDKQTGQGARRIRVMLSYPGDLNRRHAPWTYRGEPSQFWGPMGLSPAKDGKFLLYFISDREKPAPYAVLLDREKGFMEEFKPVGTGISCLSLSMFFYKNTYHMVIAPRENEPVPGKKVSFQCFTSGDLRRWKKQTVTLSFPAPPLTSTLVFQQLEGQLYLFAGQYILRPRSPELSEWNIADTVPGYEVTGLYRHDKGYGVLLVDDTYGYDDVFHAHGAGLKNWDKIYYTGLPFYRYSFLPTPGRSLLVPKEPGKEGWRIGTIDTASLPADTDGDGLTDREEERLFTSKTNPDTDGDGVPDKTDPNPLRVPSPKPTDTAVIRQLVMKHYLENNDPPGEPRFLVITVEGAETQSFELPGYRVLCLNPAESRVYLQRLEEEGRRERFLRIYFSSITISPDRSGAVVEFSYSYARKWGAGFQVKLKKINAVWTVTAFKRTRVS